MKLFIVESPNKCSTLKKILGSEYHVAASVGHIRSIPAKGMNIDIANGFEPKFEIMKGKADVVSSLKKLASQAEEIILATDQDREGEAIAFHIFDIFPKKDQQKCTRVTFTEITSNAIKESLKNKRPINDNLVSSQKARQVLDRLIGYVISPLLWSKVASKTSAGRVQSVALKIVADREKEIKEFKPEDFWYIDADLKSKEGDFLARVITKDKDNRYLDEKLVEKEYKELETSTYLVDKIEKKEKRIPANPPFDTSSLQTTASTIMNWPIKKTAQVSQHLYEKGHCFLPGALIQLRSGEILPIEDAVKNGDTQLNSTNLFCHRDIEVEATPLSFNFSGNVNKIKTSTNCIDVTSDHVFPVYDSIFGEIIDKKANDILIDTDYLLYSKETKMAECIVKTSVLDVFKNVSCKEKIIIHFKSGFLSSRIKTKDLCKFGIKYPTRYKYIKNDMLPFNIAISLFSDSDIEIGYSGLKWSSGMSYCLTIPFYLNNSLISYMSGLIISDGHLNEKGFHLSALLAKNPTKINICEIVDIKKEINDLVKQMGVRESKNLSYKNRLLSLLFHQLGIPYGNKSGIVQTPKAIMKWSNECKMAFIAGLFDGDGYFAINKVKGRNVSIQSGYTSKSDRLINELQIILSNFGFVSRIHKDNRTDIKTLKISILDTPQFNNLIKNDSLIKTKIYDMLEKKLDKSIIKSNARDPYGVPLSKVLIDEIEKSVFTKNEISKELEIDIWNFTSKKNNIPINYLLKIAKKIKSDKLMDLSNYRFDKIISNDSRYYEGDVFCFETSNNYFHIQNSLITHNCTYIRTDSYSICPESIEEARKLIKNKAGDCYLPQKPNYYKKKAKSASQEAHECIRPTDCSYTGNDLGGDEQKLYKLIRERFIACQMAPMIVDTVAYHIKSSSKKDLIAKGQTVQFDGWSKVYSHTMTKENVLPNVSEKEDLKLKELIKTKGTTKPPPRYNEGSLVKKMEEEGVGRPSTYPAIMENIQSREYVKKMNKKGVLEATELGIRVSDYLSDHFSNFIMDIKYTALLESYLDIIEDGTKTYLEVVKETYDKMMDEVKKARGEASKVVSETKCLICNEGNVVEKGGKFGVFYACDRYPECKTIFSIDSEGKLVQKISQEIDKSKECPDCKKAKRKGYLLKRKNKKDNTFFYGCNQYPKCKYTESGTVEDSKA